ncbi:MAG: polyprenyl synthetase family protein [Fusobacteriaceae bacterium]
MKSSKIFENYARKKIEKIYPELIDYISKIFDTSFLKVSEKLSYLKNPYVNSFRDGKLLRSVLVCLGYEMFAKNFEKEERNKKEKEVSGIFFPSIAYEVFQTSILFHDDIIDNGEMRRGKKTIHKILEKIYSEEREKKLEESVHKSKAITICLGDYGLVLTTNLILNSKFDDAIKIKALKRFCKDLNDTVMGEIFDIELSEPLISEKITEEEIFKLAYYKTSKYTISGPLCFGAIFGGAEENILKILSDFGDNIGISFQIHDDIMGIFGERTGKTKNSDIKEGKMTILFYHAFKNSDEKNKKILLELYGKKNISEKEVNIIKNIFEKTGSLEYATQSQNKYRDKALKFLEDLNNEPSIKESMKNILQDFSRYVTRQ